MRVITGTARGRSLQTLTGEDVRPTTEKVKESIFSIIQFEIEGRRVLDLFGGSGQLGIEALSRGAAKAVFIDSDRRAVDIIRENLETTGLSDKAAVIRTDSVAYVTACREAFDIALLDPPYAAGLLQKVLPVLGEKMNVGGIIVCESPVGESLPEKVGNYVIYREYKYGKIKITVYRDT